MSQITLNHYIYGKNKKQLHKVKKLKRNQMKYKQIDYKYKFKEDLKDSYKSITFFKDREGNPISRSLVFEQTDNVWFQNWKTYNPRNDLNEMMHRQIERRIHEQGEAEFRRKVRDEPLSDENIKKRLVKGLTGEIFVYEELTKLQFNKFDIGIPRDDGASWFADIPTFSGDFIECKTTQGDYIPGQYRRLLKEKDHKKKQREYYHNSPSYCLNIADKYGDKTNKSHACKAARGVSLPNEFFCGIRNRLYKGKRQMKISFIIRMIDLERKFKVDGNLVRVFDMIVKPWDDDRSEYIGFVKGKARLIEDLLIETFTKYKIPFYKPIDNTFNPNGFVEEKDESPKTVMDVPYVKTSYGQFDLLEDSDEED